MRAIFYDGVTAMRREADVIAAPDGIDLAASGGEREIVPTAQLVRLNSGHGTVRLGHRDRPGWRLILPADDVKSLAALLPAEARYGRWVDRLGLWRAAGAFALVAGAVLLIGHVAPEWIAPHVPQRWESSLGEALVGDFGDNRCRGLAGSRALMTLAERIAPGVTAPGAGHINFSPLDFGIFNAAALPGAQIIIFRGMLVQTRDPDAIAGVLAHEIAHVRRRHVTASLIRELGIGSLIRLFAGGIGANSEQLVSLSFTRASEVQADGDAIAMLRAANIDPRPTARLFAKLAADSGERVGDSHSYSQFLASHPVSRERAKLFASSYDPRIAYRPVLGSEESAALSAVCAKPAPAK